MAMEYDGQTTRFWISSIVSQSREIADARAVFKDTKSKTTSAIQ
jgi:hypothetical protein